MANDAANVPSGGAPAPTATEGGGAESGGWPKLTLSGVKPTGAASSNESPPAGAPVVNPGDPKTATDPNPAAEVAQPQYWSPDEATGAQEVLLKINGKDVPTKVSELTALAQKGAAADQVFQEAARIRKEFADKDAMLDGLMRTPEQFFEEMVAADEASALAWMDKLVGRAIAYRNMTPEQRKLSSYERAERERAAEATQQQHAARQQRLEEAWNKAVHGAGLPDNPMGHMVAAEMRERVQQNMRTGKSMTTDELAAFGKERLAALRKTVRDTLSAEERAELVRPEDIAARATEVVRKTQPMIPSTAPQQPRQDNGRYAPGPKARTYDPFT